MSIILYTIFFLILIVCGLGMSYLLAVDTCLFFSLYIDRSLGVWQHKYPPVSLIHYFISFWKEYFYMLGKFYLFPLKFFNLDRGLKANEYAVLLIHGYARTQTDWIWMRKQIANLPVFLVNMRPSYAPIAQITEMSIPNKIAYIKEKTGCKKIILIGHSMGGLAASYYSEYLDQDQNIAAVISIGTPFHGTRVSIAGIGENSREMCPGSQFLHELRNKISQSPKKYFQIGSQFENLVFPWESAFLPETPDDRKFLVELTTHLSMLHSKEVSAKINQWLGAV